MSSGGGNPRRARCNAYKLAEQLMEGESEYLYWGGLYLPLSVATTHFAVIGSTGSGKTILIRLLMERQMVL